MCRLVDAVGQSGPGYLDPNGMHGSGQVDAATVLEWFGQAGNRHTDGLAQFLEQAVVGR